MQKIKTKITAGVGLLFILILILSVLGIFFINRIAQGFKGTIKDNYHSINFTYLMLNNLDDIYNLTINKVTVKYGEDSLNRQNKLLFYQSDTQFEHYLKLELSNITEHGEKEAAEKIRLDYEKFIESARYVLINNGKLSVGDFTVLYKNTRSTIFNVYKLNMDAVIKRNTDSEKTALEVTFYMFLVGSISIIATLFFLFSFPGKIVSPITELTAKINAISKRDYNQKLNINSNDEMGNLAGSFNVMVQRLKEYEETNLDQLLFEKKRMDAVVKNLEDGVLILDENKKIILTNNSLLKLAGLKEEDTINKYASDIAAINDLIKTMIQNLIKIGDTDQEEEIKPIKISLNGKENYYSIEHIAVDLKSSVNKMTSLVGYIIMLKNVTLFQQRDAAKTNLIATVSHELKTPLSSINLSIKLLEDARIGAINEEQKGLINSIRQQSIRLSKVVNELLDFSQAETGNIKLKITGVRPEDVVDLAVIALMMLLSEKKIQLETELIEPLPFIKADLEKTVWVLVNIINNAIRYSPVGGTITLQVLEEVHFIKFIIKDQGPGIPEEDCGKIFEKFVQVGNKTSKGSGLGLAIAKEFVLAQGGKIWVESIIGKGSTFLFTIPKLKS
jgi:two-component system, NtrC family, sensor histidine kinase KinB